MPAPSPRLPGSPPRPAHAASCAGPWPCTSTTERSFTPSSRSPPKPSQPSQPSGTCETSAVPRTHRAQDRLLHHRSEEVAVAASHVREDQRAAVHGGRAALDEQHPVVGAERAAGSDRVVQRPDVHLRRLVPGAQRARLLLLWKGEAHEARWRAGQSPRGPDPGTGLPGSAGYSGRTEGSAGESAGCDYFLRAHPGARPRAASPPRSTRPRTASTLTSTKPRSTRASRRNRNIPGKLAKLNS